MLRVKFFWYSRFPYRHFRFAEQALINLKPILPSYKNRLINSYDKEYDCLLCDGNLSILNSLTKQLCGYWLKCYRLIKLIRGKFQYALRKNRSTYKIRAEGSFFTNRKSQSQQKLAKKITRFTIPLPSKNLIYFKNVNSLNMVKNILPQHSWKPTHFTIFPVKMFLVDVRKKFTLHHFYSFTSRVLLTKNNKLWNGKKTFCIYGCISESRYVKESRKSHL